MKPSNAVVLGALQAAYPHGVSAIELDRRYGIYRASARVYELKALGYSIETEPRIAGHTAVYRLLALSRTFDGTLGLVAG